MWITFLSAVLPVHNAIIRHNLSMYLDLLLSELINLNITFQTFALDNLNYIK